MRRKHGSIRQRSGFLFRPMTIRKEWRWLEFAKWTEYCNDKLKWVTDQWLPSSDADNLEHMMDKLSDEDKANIAFDKNKEKVKEILERLRREAMEDFYKNHGMGARDDY